MASTSPKVISSLSGRSSPNAWELGAPTGLYPGLEGLQPGGFVLDIPQSSRSMPVSYDVGLERDDLPPTLDDEVLSILRVAGGAPPRIGSSYPPEPFHITVGPLGASDDTAIAGIAIFVSRDSGPTTLHSIDYYPVTAGGPEHWTGSTRFSVDQGEVQTLCVSVAAIDTSGNSSDSSAPACVDLAEAVGPSFGCGQAADPSSTLLLGLGLLLLAARRRNALLRARVGHP